MSRAMDDYDQRAAHEHFVGEQRLVRSLVKSGLSESEAWHLIFEYERLPADTRFFDAISPFWWPRMVEDALALKRKQGHL